MNYVLKIAFKWLLFSENQRRLSLLPFNLLKKLKPLSQPPARGILKMLQKSARNLFDWNSLSVWAPVSRVVTGRRRWERGQHAYRAPARQIDAARDGPPSATVNGGTGVCAPADR